jgi:hypothetical protein
VLGATAGEVWMFFRPPAERMPAGLAGGWLRGPEHCDNRLSYSNIDDYRQTL